MRSHSPRSHLKFVTQTQSQGRIPATATAVFAKRDRIIRATHSRRSRRSSLDRAPGAGIGPRSHQLDQRLLRGAMRRGAGARPGWTRLPPPRRRAPQWCTIAAPAFPAFDSSILRRQTFDTLVTLATTALRENQPSTTNAGEGVVDDWAGRVPARESASAAEPLVAAVCLCSAGGAVATLRPWAPRKRGVSLSRAGSLSRRESTTHESAGAAL